ncbi:MAG: heme o synthase [Chitinophagaceae bacterium]|jgi:protoheme IX farnesyltransferase|nr:heme o synthase [Chitinophagaceae bacterium]
MNKETASNITLLKVKDYVGLTKMTLSFTVVFSCVVCYLLSPSIVEYNLKMIVLLFVVGLFIAGSANAINQAVEKDTDAMMRRTANRPVASGRISPGNALVFAGIIGIIGVLLMYCFFNVAAALISAGSLFLYAFIYTPLKKVNAIAVIVGAVPGALPCLIGWVAGFPKDEPVLWSGGLILFAIQFLWQFPHFWAIAWVAHNDYSKAGFKLLPSDKGPTKFTAMQTVVYSLMMIPVGVLPFYMGKANGDAMCSGYIGLIIIVLCNIFMLVQSLRLYISMDVKSARRVMFSSYIYLPIVLLTLLACKA